jgi:hypothetical protein
MLRVSHLSGFNSYLVSSAAAVGALLLLDGEADGFAIDASTADGGTVAVINTGDPTDDLSNVILDASNLVQAGTSPKLLYHASSPYVRWSPHNMFLNSGTPATQNVTLVVGFVYTVTVTGAGGGSITGSDGASGVATTGSPATFTATTTTGTFTYAATLTTIQLNRGPIATAYLATTGAIRIGIPQTYHAATTRYGIWVEPAATNLLLQSEDFATTWTNTNSSETTNATAAPDAQTTADKLVEAADVGQVHSIDQTSASLTSGVVYTFSCFLKAEERTWARLSGATTRFPDNFHADFNLSAGTAGTVGAGATASSIAAVGNGWYRCSVTATCDSTGTNAMSITIGEGDTDVTYNGDGSSGIYVWGAQLEVGATPTSYVPTVTAGATRATDLITVATSTYPHSATNGTVFAQVIFLDTAAVTEGGSSATVINIDDGTANERMLAVRATNTNVSSFVVTDGGGTQVNIADGPAMAGHVVNKIGYSWAANDFDLCVNGTLGTEDTSGSLPTVTTMRLGRRTATTGGYSGIITQVVYLPRTAADAELQSETT